VGRSSPTNLAEDGGLITKLAFAPLAEVKRMLTKLALLNSLRFIAYSGQPFVCEP